MSKRNIIISRSLVGALVGAIFLVICNKSGSEEIKQEAVIHNERGLYYFNEAKFELEARRKFDEAAIKYEEAVAEFEKAIEKDPSYIEAHANLGKVYTYQKRFSEAVEEYEIVVDLIPDNIDARIALASSYEKEGRYDDAIRQLQAAISLAPDNEAKEVLRTLIKRLAKAQQ